jgi:hypothetical protein
VNEETRLHLSKPIEHRDVMGYIERVECRACGASKPVHPSLVGGRTIDPSNHAAWCIFFTSVLK